MRAGTADPAVERQAIQMGLERRVSEQDRHCLRSFWRKRVLDRGRSQGASGRDGKGQGAVWLWSLSGIRGLCTSIASSQAERNLDFILSSSLPPFLSSFHLFSLSANKYALSTYHVRGTVPSAGDTSVNEKTRRPEPYILGRRNGTQLSEIQPIFFADGCL